MKEYEPVHANDLEDTPTNNSSNPHFTEVADKLIARRGFLKAGLGAAALSFLGTSSLLKSGDALAQGQGPTLGFGSVPLPPAMGTGDLVVVPNGYSVQVLYAWGDPIGKAGLPAGTPAWSGTASETVAEQELQSGAHHDGMHFFPFPARGAGTTGGFSNTRGLLAMNHEYVDQGFLFADGTANFSLAKIRKSQAAHGVSVVEARRTSATGPWQIVRPSAYARRITTNTPMTISGPASSELGSQALGTVNNCANGFTPWGTYLTCEENFNGYFGAKTLNASGNPITDTTFVPNEIEARYGINAGGFGYNWHFYDERFDLNTIIGRANQYNFGWVVEIDPFNPNSTPVKRTALGRVKHEGAVYALAKDGRVVIYTGDDQANDYLYKFVTEGTYNPTNRAANLNLLDSGTLYVARFDAGNVAGDDRGTGVWLPLTRDNPAIAARFATLGDMLLATRIAADIAGATKMDRPEWVAVDYNYEGRSFVTMTNNSGRAVGSGPPVDEANPRANNRYGHIIEWIEDGNDHGSTTFSWDIFVRAGDPDLPANIGTPQVGNINGDKFGSPDGLWVDGGGILWIQTDISSGTLGVGAGVGGYINMTNNMMLAANPETGLVKRFLTGPRGCEVTGVIMTPDRKSMFVNIQHPGEGAGDASDPTDPLYPNRVSSWPSSQGYGFQGTPPQANLRPRSGTVVITKNDGGVVGT